ncbi:hypothetical protein T02_12162 [Trichinella nativa]|uniref:Uncharacterized protein n=1 Tax=Trichinella nativa TaxID=6335 RepID=A0A0V1L0Y9_9BILA|nr:hypothetical protein T02_12162 [Trichinella nativa]
MHMLLRKKLAMYHRRKLPDIIKLYNSEIINPFEHIVSQHWCLNQEMDILYNLNATNSLSVQIFAVVITLAGACANKDKSEDENAPTPEMLQSENDCSRTCTPYTPQQSIPTLAAPQCHIAVPMPPPVILPLMISPASDALPVVTETLSREATAPAAANKVDLEMQSWAQGESALDTMANVPSITRSYAERIQNSLNKNFL